MKWSWRLATLAGIGIYVHATFVLLLLLVGWSQFNVRHQWNDAIQGLVYIVTLFVIVVLHELGHATAAKRYGIRTRDITLLPIGGLARLERMPSEPRQELVVALAGPAVNVLLAILIFCVLGMESKLMPVNAATMSGTFLTQLFWINLVLAGFNLLPAFPMDGGRVLRALLAIRMNYVRATNLAAAIGQTMAVLFGIAGLFGNPILILIAVFVWIGAAQEAKLLQVKSTLDGVAVRDVMITDFRTLAPDDRLSRAVELLLQGYQHDFPVVTDGRLIGFLTRAALVHGLARLGQDLPVADAMEKDFPVVDTLESAEAAFSRLREGNARSAPVIEHERLVGMLTSENVAEFLMVQGALKGGASSEPLHRTHPLERPAT